MDKEYLNNKVEDMNLVSGFPESEVNSDELASLDRDYLADMPLSTKSKLAVFGGSFDPIHLGHVAIAEHVIKEKIVDEVLFVPARQAPHKLEQASSDAKKRLEMINLILGMNSGFCSSDIEVLHDKDTSYTIDTMETLNRVFQDYELFFLMGMDSLVQLHTWHRATELVQRNNFLIFPRAGVLAPSYVELAAFFGYKSAEKLLNSIIEMPTVDVSATVVREQCLKGNSVVDLVPEPVIQFILKHNLYRK